MPFVPPSSLQRWQGKKQKVRRSLRMMQFLETNFNFQPMKASARVWIIRVWIWRSYRLPNFPTLLATVAGEKNDRNITSKTLQRQQKVGWSDLYESKSDRIYYFNIFFYFLLQKVEGKFFYLFGMISKMPDTSQYAF